MDEKDEKRKQPYERLDKEKIRAGKESAFLKKSRQAKKENQAELNLNDEEATRAYRAVNKSDESIKASRGYRTLEKATKRNDYELAFHVQASDKAQVKIEKKQVKLVRRADKAYRRLQISRADRLKIFGSQAIDKTIHAGATGMKANAQSGVVMAKQSMKLGVRQAIFSETDSHEELKDAKDSLLKVQRTKRGTKMFTRGTKIAAKATYSLSNRTKNMIRGRGFVKTPDEVSKFSALRRRYQKSIARLKQAKVVQKTKRVTSFLGRPFAFIVKFKAASFGVIFGLVFIIMVSIFGMGALSSGVVVQSDKQLTQAYAYMTLLDAEHSDGNNTFYTNFDDTNYYMNVKYSDYDIDSSYTPKDSTRPAQSYKDIVKGLWEAQNGKSDPYELKSLDSQITDKSSEYYLEDDELERYKLARDEIHYQTVGELGALTSTGKTTVLRRYGYESSQGQSEPSLYTSTAIQATLGENIQAPMSGRILLDSQKDTLVIVAGLEKLTLRNLDTSRYKGDEEVTQGEILGQATSGQISVMYEMKDKVSDTDYYTVNPAFYFPDVSYVQATQLASDIFSPSGDISANAQIVINYLKSQGFTDNGIAAILGNWSVESSINPKRAEGDYLPPPVGATDSSWDDPAWLAMGGMEIYNGKYPNIIHRGLGLGQWTDTSDGGVRHTSLLNFANSQSKKWYDLQLQLDFMLHADTGQNTAKAIGASTDDVSVLTEKFLTFWEGNPGNALQERQAAAKNWLAYIQGGGVGKVSSGQAVFDKYQAQVQATLGSLPSEEVKTGFPYSGNSSPKWQCVYYAYNRARQLGIPVPSTLAMGNGGEWAGHASAIPGATTSHTPHAGDIASGYAYPFSDGGSYGHVAIVEYVNPDGSFVVSEESGGVANSYSWRELPASMAAVITFIHVSR